MEWSNDDAELPELEDFEEDYSADEDALEEPGPSSRPAKKRGRKNFITARLVAALDNAKVSDGMAVHILVAAAEALGHRVEELVINRSSIHRIRQENRLRESNEISSAFNDNV